MLEYVNVLWICERRKTFKRRRRPKHWWTFIVWRSVQMCRTYLHTLTTHGHFKRNTLSALTASRVRVTNTCLLLPVAGDAHRGWFSECLQINIYIWRATDMWTKKSVRWETKTTLYIYMRVNARWWSQEARMELNEIVFILWAIVFMNGNEGICIYMYMHIGWSAHKCFVGTGLVQIRVVVFMVNYRY